MDSLGLAWVDGYDGYGAIYRGVITLALVQQQVKVENRFNFRI